MHAHGNRGDSQSRFLTTFLILCLRSKAPAPTMKALPPARPISTPCRVDGDTAENSNVPDISDMEAPRPESGVLRISAAAADQRMRRIFAPNTKGEYKVSEDILKQWKNKKRGREPLRPLFQACGFEADCLSWVVCS